METPHLPRRHAKYETRQEVSKCSGQCEDFQKAKIRILELEEENRRLITKLNQVNEDLRVQSQKTNDSQITDCLRHVSD